MLLCLPPRRRLAFLIGEVLGVTDDVGAEVLDTSPAARQMRDSAARPCVICRGGDMSRASIKELRVLPLLLLSFLAVGCTGGSVPAAPTGSRSTASSAPLLYDPTLSGSAYLFRGIDGTELWFSNNQNDYWVAFDTNTNFRRAVLNSWPSDACRSRAETYNLAGEISTTDGDIFLNALANLVTCNARIIVQFGNQVPPNPIRILSFQPIP
jgi:hypothetical protein